MNNERMDVDYMTFLIRFYSSLEFLADVHKHFYENHSKPGGVARPVIPGCGTPQKEDYCKSEARLVYTVTSRPAGLHLSQSTTGYNETKRQHWSLMSDL